MPILLRQLIRNIGDFAGTCVPANQGNIALLSKKKKRKEKRKHSARYSHMPGELKEMKFRITT